MNIYDIMTINPTLAHPKDSIADAAYLMYDIDSSALPVGEDIEHCIGMITDRDILLRYIAKGKDPKTTTVSDIMKKDLNACHETDTLEKSAQSMQKKRVNHLIVKNKNDKITGIISFESILSKAGSKYKSHQIFEHVGSKKYVA